MQPPMGQDAADVAEVTRNFLMGFVLPLWLAAGVADWDLSSRDQHRDDDRHRGIAHASSDSDRGGDSGSRRPFLEIASPVIALMIASFLLHDMTALWDVSYAVTLRDVRPIEQHVHSFLEMVPLMAVAFVCVLHWPQVLALFGIGRKKVDWSLRLKSRPLPWRYVTTMLGTMAALEWGPCLEGELARTLTSHAGRADTKSSTVTPEIPSALTV